MTLIGRQVCPQTGSSSTDLQSVTWAFVDNGGFGLLTDNVDSPFGRNVFKCRLAMANGGWVPMGALRTVYHFPTAVV